MESVFWICLIGVLYAYFLYPGLLLITGRMFPKPIDMAKREYFPAVSLIMPVHNEAGVIASKLNNIDRLDYPTSQLNIIIVSDGSTDNTVDVIRQHSSRFTINVIETAERKGKANALNEGLQAVDSEIVVFSDASILLEPNSITEIVKPFQDPVIGCVSGEDHIAEVGGEGLYGRYELFLRNRESALGSIVGASGSFYAQRASLCKNFEEGLAPDFLSVLNTVAQGFRAVTEPKAVGYMSAVKSSSDEFQRKVRTLIRGMTALFSRKELLNPFSYGLFSVFLISHKLMRWLVPAFLVAIFVSSIFLLDTGIYQLMFAVQIIFYSMAALSYFSIAKFQDLLPGRIAMFFCMVNLAIVVAWYRYITGHRQELWNPSKRSSIETTE